MAQLVERLLCTQDVSGSSPLTSTEKPNKNEQQPILIKQERLLENSSQNLENCIVIVKSNFSIST